MDLSTGLHITQKGEDEVKRRAYKLSIRKRSVLILLNNPRTVEYVLDKTVLNRDEIGEEIHALIREGFIAVSEGAAPVPGAPRAVTNVPALGANFYLDDEIIVSEAKFLLVDFCVDGFGTRSQQFVDEIRASSSVKDLGSCLRKVFAETEKHCPERLQVLTLLVRDINETA